MTLDGLVIKNPFADNRYTAAELEAIVTFAKNDIEKRVSYSVTAQRLLDAGLVKVSANDISVVMIHNGFRRKRPREEVQDVRARALMDSVAPRIGMLINHDPIGSAGEVLSDIEGILNFRTMRPSTKLQAIADLIESFRAAGSDPQ